MIRWALVGVAACGRVDFDERVDAPRAIPTLVANAAMFTPSGNIPVTIEPTGSGHLLIVGIEAAMTTSVASISDDAQDVFVSANARSINGNGFTEIWYAADSAAAATFVTVVLSPGSGGEAWVLELSGAQTSAPLDVVAILDNQSVGAIAQAPAVQTATPNEIVFSLVNVSARPGVDAPDDAGTRLREHRRVLQRALNHRNAAVAPHHIAAVAMSH
jgi:hypothetical protein